MKFKSEPVTLSASWNMCMISPQTEFSLRKIMTPYNIFLAETDNSGSPKLISSATEKKKNKELSGIKEDTTEVWFIRGEFFPSSHTLWWGDCADFVFADFSSSLLLLTEGFFPWPARRIFFRNSITIIIKFKSAFPSSIRER